MKVWNRTDIDWTEEWTTNIKDSAWWDNQADRKPPHSFRMRIWSQQNGTGEGAVSFNPRSGSGLCQQDYLLASKQLKVIEIEGVVVTWNESFNRVNFSFRLKNGESFSDKAIPVARSIAMALGITGKSLIDYLARFNVSQTTLVWHKEEWISFADHLRLRHNLPELLGTGWSHAG